MADEIRATYDTGFTLYALAFNAAGEVWNVAGGSANSFTAYAAADIDNYDIPLGEIAVNSGQYRADWPVDVNMVEGIYSVVLFEQAGGAPVVADDERIGETGTMIWDGGSTEVDIFEVMDIVESTIMGPDGDDLTVISDQIDGVQTDATAILLDTGTTIPAYILSDVIGASGDTLETLSDQLDVIGTGSGVTAETYTVIDSITGLPIDGVRVWLSTDLAGTNVIRLGHTNGLGKVTFHHDLPTGTPIYVWREKAGYIFVNPDTEYAT